MERGVRERRMERARKGSARESICKRGKECDRDGVCEGERKRGQQREAKHVIEGGSV